MKPAVDQSNFFTRKIMFPVAVYIMPFWPKGNPTAPEMIASKEGSTPKDFYTELSFLLKMLDVFAEREPNKFHPHPMFGTLTKDNGPICSQNMFITTLNSLAYSTYEYT